MGQDIRVDWRGVVCPLATVLEKLAGAGVPSVLVLVEGNLQAPHTPPPTEWREVRLKCEAGMITLRHDSDHISVRIFGNADDGLREAQRKVADALKALAS